MQQYRTWAEIYCEIWAKILAIIGHLLGSTWGPIGGTFWTQLWSPFSGTCVTYFGPDVPVVLVGASVTSPTATESRHGET